MMNIRHRTDGMMDHDRITLGREIGKIIIAHSTEYPPGQSASDPQGLVTALLENMGFSRIEYFNISHDILLIGLWRFADGGRLTDEFYLEFSGTDVLYLTLLCGDDQGHQVEL